MKRETERRFIDWTMRLGRSVRVEDTVPADFPFYLRILHKAQGSSEPGPGPVAAPQFTWREIAGALDKTLEPETIWADFSGAYGEPVDVPGIGTVFPPEEGRLDRNGFISLANVLADSTAGSFFAAFWTGWGMLSNDQYVAKLIRRRKTVPIQGENYLLYSLDADELRACRFMALPEFGWTTGHGLTPNYLWPRNESWFLGTNIDLDSSILAGSESVLAVAEGLTELELIRVQPSTRLTSSFPKGQ